MTSDETAVTLRPARPEDVAPLAELWYAGFVDGHVGHVPEALVEVRTRESFDDRVTAALDHTTVAEVADEIAGFVMVVGDEVEQVYVGRDHRGTGVATVVLGEGERLVAQNGHAEAWLAVATGNARARRFYERRGWTDGGAFDYPANTQIGPVPVPCHRYVKAVRPG
ncbi:GNAT family N-acetyltransferase [Nocardioides speluncae]|uniref:GNAT family N-acetyltransferase n=1 Tax=Nocardioides speluncae TaxID=2670337 RepID=UPI000D69AEBB|nr:GNAT family N-acetyltransferase [Nocardioides speluncae]